jgi:16S rRNA (guanine(1405)-N(7))-methyltransferase
MEEAFADVFSRTGVPNSVLDLACGLMPFAWPWLHLPSRTRYEAWDIDARLIANVNAFLHRIGRPATAYCRDVLVTAPETEVDLVFLLKTAPCLEQQETGATLRLLRQLRARYVLLSFPTKSHGGREKGMIQHYGQFAKDLSDALHVSCDTRVYSTEIFCLFTFRDGSRTCGRNGQDGHG